MMEHTSPRSTGQTPIVTAAASTSGTVVRLIAYRTNSNRTSQGEGRNKPPGPYPLTQPIEPSFQHRSSGSSSAALRVSTHARAYTSRGCTSRARHRPNAPLHEVQTLHAATDAPHRLRRCDYEGLSQVDQSAKLALTTNVQNHAPPSRTSTPGPPTQNVAGAHR